MQPPRFANLALIKAPNNVDPREDVRSTPLARVQTSAFRAPAGAVIDVCGGQPCGSAVYTP